MRKGWHIKEMPHKDNGDVYLIKRSEQFDQLEILALLELIDWRMWLLFNVVGTTFFPIFLTS